jgi:hypothetical protein
LNFDRLDCGPKQNANNEERQQAYDPSSDVIPSFGSLNPRKQSNDPDQIDEDQPS